MPTTGDVWFDVILYVISVRVVVYFIELIRGKKQEPNPKPFSTMEEELAARLDKADRESFEAWQKESDAELNRYRQNAEDELDRARRRQEEIIEEMRKNAYRRGREYSFTRDNYREAHFARASAKVKEEKRERPVTNGTMDFSKMSFYNILGVRSGASRTEIKKAYIDTAKRYHPDVNEEDTTTQMQYINKAYTNLKGLK